MDELLALAHRIATREAEKPATAYRRLQRDAENGTDPTMCDRDLVIGAREAIRKGEFATATIALNELALRMAIDEPIEHLVEGRAA